MLTGLEQYYWEKAGYFIRRQALSPDEVSSCLQAVSQLPAQNRITPVETLPPACLEAIAHPTVLGIIQDALGPDTRFYQAAILAHSGEKALPGAWTRDMLPEGNPLQAQDAVLLRHQDCLTVRIALDSDESLHVAPGSHVSPLPPEQEAAFTADPHSDLEGTVCMRLAPGDALFYNPNLVHRTQINPAVPTCALEFTWVAHHHPFTAELPGVTPDLLNRLPAALHSFFKFELS
jgi:hypothetical protein